MVGMVLKSKHGQSGIDYYLSHSTRVDPLSSALLDEKLHQQKTFRNTKARTSVGYACCQLRILGPEIPL